MIPFHDNSSRKVIQFLVLLIVIDEPLVCNHILPAVKQNTFPRLTITAAPANFLIKRLDTFGHIVMNDVSYI